MICFHSSISANQHIDMTKSVNSIDPSSKMKQITQFQKTKNHLNIPACDQSRSAMIDVLISIAVIGACGFLLYPYATVLAHKCIELGEEVIDVLTEEIVRAPLLFGCLGLSLLFTSTALVAIIVYTDPNCGKPGCRGLRQAAEFDIQLETEESVKKSNCLANKKKGLFELHPDQHRELAAELKKMAPVNGRAVMVFRTRCGCSVGRMEVPGPRKSGKVKK